MPVTMLDATSALVLIDLQGIVSLPLAHPAGEIVGRAAKLARAFRGKGLPVVLVNVAGRAPGRTEAGPPALSFPPGWDELIPELEQQAADHLVTKHRIGAFLGTDLDDYLRGRGVTQIVLAGIATGSGVEATARSAYDLGYNVTFATDAMTDRSDEAHRYSAEKIFPRIGETGTTDDILALLKGAAR